jgi:hypothetical protein
MYFANNDAIKDGSQERTIVALWPNVKSRWCISHMKANFHINSKTRSCQNCSSGCASRISRGSSMRSRRS